MTTREELRLLVDSLPDAAVEELAALGRLLDRQTRYSAVEEVTAPDEVVIVRELLLDDGTEAEYTLEEAKEELAARRRTRGS